jgi:hypothetical protein
VAAIVPSDGVFASPVGPLTGELVEVRLRVVRVDVVEAGWASLVAGLVLEGVLVLVPEGDVALVLEGSASGGSCSWSCTSTLLGSLTVWMSEGSCLDSCETFPACRA